jgi:Ca-activated chloride channel family protein
MDMRIPLGTAAAALLLLALGLHLASSTALSPITQTFTDTPQPEAAPGRDRAVSPVPLVRQQSGTTMDSEAIGFAPPAQPIVIVPQETGDQFIDFDESRVKAVAEDPVSTFSIDVDTASYSYVRRLLEDGYLPEPDAVRIEELINYFPYDYPAADSTAVPFAPTIAYYPAPWNTETRLLHIGIKGFVPPVTEDKPANLVFLIDTSGSMNAPDKLPLLKRAFRLLVEELTANDTVSIVVYAGSAGVVLEPTPAREKAKILHALDTLAAGGSTAGGRGDRACL